MKWKQKLLCYIKGILEKEEPISDKTPNIINSTPMGLSVPVQIILEIEVPAGCRNCGVQWRQKLTNQYAITNSIYMYEKCTKCHPLTSLHPTVKLQRNLGITGESYPSN